MLQGVLAEASWGGISLVLQLSGARPTKCSVGNSLVSDKEDASFRRFSS